MNRTQATALGFFAAAWAALVQLGIGLLMARGYRRSGAWGRY